jgi:hypothetical protein
MHSVHVGVYFCKFQELLNFFFIVLYIKISKNNMWGRPLANKLIKKKKNFFLSSKLKMLRVCVLETRHRPLYSFFCSYTLSGQQDGAMIKYPRSSTAWVTSMVLSINGPSLLCP